MQSGNALRRRNVRLPRWAVSTPRRARSHSSLAVHEGAPCWVGDARSRDDERRASDDRRAARARTTSS
eukprot:2121119-Prymnesium_polylepis.1